MNAVAGGLRADRSAGSGPPSCWPLPPRPVWPLISALCILHCPRESAGSRFPRSPVWCSFWPGSQVRSVTW